MLKEFRTDYNQTHFVRNDTFKKAADSISGPARKIFIEFLERSCTAEFSGFLLYKELGRRLKKTNPVGAQLPDHGQTERHVLQGLVPVAEQSLCAWKAQVDGCLNSASRPRRHSFTVSAYTTSPQLRSCMPSSAHSEPSEDRPGRASPSPACQGSCKCPSLAGCW